MSATVLALLAAFLFALGSTLQQRGTLDTSAPEGDPRFLAEIIHSRVWLMGMALHFLGCVFQALALARGPLATVQALCSLSLVFALPLGARLTGQVIGRRSLIGAFTTLVGIIIFVGIGQPQDGSSLPTGADWLTAGLCVTALMALFSFVGGRRRGPLSAILFAAAAGTGFAFQAAVTKEFVTIFGDGFMAILTSWTTYALLIAAVAGFALQQSALKTGFLAPTMASCNTTILAVSLILGISLFGETLSKGQGRLSPALIGLAMAIIGVILLASPEAKKAEPVTA
jgi:drug/metabolite transporter (DMT)-like permease